MFYTKANTFLFKRIKYEGEFWKYKFWQSYKDTDKILDNIKLDKSGSIGITGGELL